MHLQKFYYISWLVLFTTNTSTKECGVIKGGIHPIHNLLQMIRGEKNTSMRFKPTNTITKDSYRHHNHYTIYTHKNICPIVYIFVRTPRRVPQLCGICPDVRQSVLPFRSDFCPDSRQTSPHIIRGPVRPAKIQLIERSSRNESLNA